MTETAFVAATLAALGLSVAAVYIVGRATTGPARRLFRELAGHCDGRLARWSATPRLHGRYRNCELRMKTSLGRRSADFSITVAGPEAVGLRIRVMPEAMAGASLTQPLLGPRLEPIPGEIGALPGSRRCVADDPARAADFLAADDRKAALERVIREFATPSIGPDRVSAVRRGYPRRDETAGAYLALLDDFVRLAGGKIPER